MRAIRRGHPREPRVQVGRGLEENDGTRVAALVSVRIAVT